MLIRLMFHTGTHSLRTIAVLNIDSLQPNAAMLRCFDKIKSNSATLAIKKYEKKHLHIRTYGYEHTKNDGML